MNLTLPRLDQLIPLLSLLHTASQPRNGKANARSEPRHRASTGFIPQQTGPFDLLKTKRPVVILDVENLTASAHRLGREFDYCTLHRLLKETGKHPDIHAVFSRTKDDTRWMNYFTECGIQPHPRTVKQVNDRNGTRATMNSDLSLAVIAGTLVNKRTTEVILGTGDGECAVEISEALKTHSARMRIVTLGVPGSISARIRVADDGYIDGNVLAGADCLIKDGLHHF